MKDLFLPCLAPTDPLQPMTFPGIVFLMKDVDRTKLYNSQRPSAHERSSDPSGDDKELLVLEARLEKATGDDRMRIEELIREIQEKREKEEGKKPPARASDSEEKKLGDE